MSAKCCNCRVAARRARGLFGPKRIIGSRCRNSSHAGGAPYIAATRNAVPSVSSRLPNSASQMRVAFSSMAWNTGSSSPGELEMACRTSEVAVCCSSASASSRSRAASFLSSTDAEAGLRTLRVAVFVPAGRSLRPCVRRVDPLRDPLRGKATSRARSNLPGRCPRGCRPSMANHNMPESGVWAAICIAGQAIARRLPQMEIVAAAATPYESVVS